MAFIIENPNTDTTIYVQKDGNDGSVNIWAKRGTIDMIIASIGPNGITFQNFDDDEASELGIKVGSDGQLAITEDYE